MWNYRIYKGVEADIEAVYIWLRQVIVFYIISTLFVNAVASDKYKEYNGNSGSCCADSMYAVSCC